MMIGSLELYAFRCLLHADFDVALESAWRNRVSAVVARFRRKLEKNPLFLSKAADRVEKKYMATKATGFQD